MNMPHDEIISRISELLPTFEASNQTKRIRAFEIAQLHIHDLIQNQKVDEDEALIIISRLFNHNPDFKKSALMMAVCLDQTKGHLHPVGFRFANDIRSDLGLELVTA